MKQWIKSLYTRWVQYSCKHDWELVCNKHQDHMYKCVDCGMIETVDRGTYL